MILSKLTDWSKEKLSSLLKVSRALLGSRPALKITLLLLVPVVAVVTVFSRAGCAIVMDNEVIAVASDRGAAESVVQDYIAELEEQSDLPVSVNEEIEYRPSWRKADNPAEIRLQLAQKLDYHFGVAGIYVDGNLVVSVKDQVTAEQVVNKLLAIYDNNGQWDAEFKQNVAAKPVQADNAKLMDMEEAVEYFRFGGQGVRTYQIKDGDNLWDIAAAVKLPVDELVLSNPELQPDRLQVGQEIKISRTSPLVDVITTYKDTRQEEILFQVQEKVDENLYLGERKVVQSGKAGQREVEYQVTMENGVEINKVEIKEKIIEEPVHQVVAKGARKLLAFRGGNGRLAYPAGGGIVSPFGTRWGRPHLGVDIAGGQGSPVVAAEAGTVTSAGYEGAYGMCVDISHGGGVVTRYAHLSSAAVKSGQSVERGQFIGRIGATGNATGPHLHFEVIVNGAHKNPALFI